MSDVSSIHLCTMATHIQPINPTGLAIHGRLLLSLYFCVFRACVCGKVCVRESEFVCVCVSVRARVCACVRVCFTSHRQSRGHIAPKIHMKMYIRRARAVWNTCLHEYELFWRMWEVGTFSLLLRHSWWLTYRLSRFDWSWAVHSNQFF